MQRWSEWFKLKSLIFIIGGVRVEIPAVSRTFWLPLFPQNILKEADINIFFKVLAKFNDYKDSKDIKKIV